MQRQPQLPDNQMKTSSDSEGQVAARMTISPSRENTDGPSLRKAAIFVNTLPTQKKNLSGLTVA